MGSSHLGYHCRPGIRLFAATFGLFAIYSGSLAASAEANAGASPAAAATPASADVVEGSWAVMVVDGITDDEIASLPGMRMESPDHGTIYGVLKTNGEFVVVDTSGLPLSALERIPPQARVRVRGAHKDASAGVPLLLEVSALDLIVTGGNGNGNGGNNNGNGGNNGGGGNGNGTPSPFPGEAPDNVPCEFPGQVPSTNPGNVPGTVPPEHTGLCETADRRLALVQIEVERGGNIVSDPWTQSFVEAEIIDRAVPFLDRIFGHMLDFSFDSNADGVENYADVFGPVVVHDSGSHCLYQVFSWITVATAELENSGALGLDPNGDPKRFCRFGPLHPAANSYNAPYCEMYDSLAVITPWDLGSEPGYACYGFQGLAFLGSGLSDDTRRLYSMMLRVAAPGIGGHEPRAVYTHELGHNLGLHHAGTTATYLPVPGGYAYGDLSNSMSGNFGLYNAAHSNLLGVFSDGIANTDASWPWQWIVDGGDSIAAPQVILTGLHAADSPGDPPNTPPLSFNTSNATMAFVVTNIYGLPLYHVSYVSQVDPNIPAPFFDASDPMDLAAPYRSYNRSLVVHTINYQRKSTLLEKINLPDPGTMSGPISVDFQTLNLSFDVEQITDEYLVLSDFTYN